MKYWVIQHRVTGLYYVTTDHAGNPFTGNTCNRARYQSSSYAHLCARALGKCYLVVPVNNAKAKIARLEAELASVKARFRYFESVARAWRTDVAK